MLHVRLYFLSYFLWYCIFTFLFRMNFTKVWWYAFHFGHYYVCAKSWQLFTMHIKLLLRWASVEQFQHSFSYNTILNILYLIGQKNIKNTKWCNESIPRYRYIIIRTQSVSNFFSCYTIENFVFYSWFFHEIVYSSNSTNTRSLSSGLLWDFCGWLGAFTHRKLLFRSYQLIDHD